MGKLKILHEHNRLQYLKCMVEQVPQYLKCMVEQFPQLSIHNWIWLLQSCICENDLVVGRQVHSVMVESEFHLNTKLLCHLIRLYSSCGSCFEAFQVFTTSNEQNVYMWTAIISAHVQHLQGEQAIILYNQMQLLGVKPNSYTFVAVLKACTLAKDLKEGKVIHANIKDLGCKLDLFVGGALVDMYTKCGSIMDAQKVFDNLPIRDVVLWSAMISGYTKHGYSWKALCLFGDMKKEGTLPNKVTFVSVLKACVIIAAIEHGRWIHIDIKQQGLQSDLFLGSTLIFMYAKCGCLIDAQKVFDNLPAQDVVSWNAIISGYVDHGHHTEAMKLLVRMQGDGIEPDKGLFICMLKAFSSIKGLDQGKLVHATIVKRGFESDLLVGSALIDMYAKVGNLKIARKVFDNLPSQDVVSWSLMIVGYADHGHGQEALKLFYEMLRKGIQPDNVTFLCILKTCASIANLVQGRLIHSKVIKTGLEQDQFIANTLLFMYSKCDSIDDAHMVFSKLSSTNVVSWNCMIAGCVEHGHDWEAIKLFENMQHDKVEPNEVTFASILNMCSSIATLEQGKLVHTDLAKLGLELNSLIGIRLLDMYAKSGSMVDAQKVFIYLSVQDVASWNALIAGSAKHGHGKEALQLFWRMHREGVQPDEVTFSCVLKVCSRIACLEQGKLIHSLSMRQGLQSNIFVEATLIDMYGKCGSLEDTFDVFSNLPVQSVISLNTMMKGFANHGHAEEAFQLFKKMQEEGIAPNEVTFLCILSVCSSTATLNWGRLIHANIIKSGLESDLHVGSSLVDMYAKCGSLDDTSEVFERLEVKNVVTWNVMISGYSDHGHCKLAQQYFESMQWEGIKPDYVTFLCLLSSCSHAGFIHEALHYLKSMREDYDLMPKSQHYVCMIDTLGRAGCLQEAETLVFEMTFQLCSVMWMNLLSSCAKHYQLELGRRAFDCLIKSDRRNTAGYVLMFNIFAAHQLWQDAHKIQEMRESL